jgi:uncharacterized phage protein (TIGR01671 family)
MNEGGSKMREIKFRAWDEKREIMYKDFNFIKSGDEGNDWIIPIVIEEGWTEKIKHIETMPHCRQQIKIMQFTGLKDKNGKEVYEEDVVLCSGIGNNADEKYNTEIVFCEEKAAFMLDAGCELFSFTEISELCEIEVIGNIYESPELIEGGTQT